jgi:hypothetical protein
MGQRTDPGNQETTMNSRIGHALAGLACFVIMAPVALADPPETPSVEREAGDRAERSAAARGRAPGTGIVRLADSDRNGIVAASEWQELLARLDADGDGEIAVDDLAGAAGRGTPGTDVKEIEARRAYFLRAYDRDRNGKIETTDLSELHRALDRDADGEISEAEAPALLRRRSKAALRP